MLVFVIILIVIYVYIKRPKRSSSHQLASILLKKNASLKWWMSRTFISSFTYALLVYFLCPTESLPVYQIWAIRVYRAPTKSCRVTGFYIRFSLYHTHIFDIYFWEAWFVEQKGRWREFCSESSDLDCHLWAWPIHAATPIYEQKMSKNEYRTNNSCHE